MKNFYYDLKFLLVMVSLIAFYYIAIKPITTTYLEGFSTGDFSNPKTHLSHYHYLHLFHILYNYYSICSLFY